MRTVIVIGNGFDIDLGWHTSYKDFFKDKEVGWRTLRTNEDDLFNYVFNHAGDNWFDLEKTVYDYCLNRSKSGITDDLAMRDSNTFEALKRQLVNFVKERSSEPVNKDSYAYYLLKQYIKEINIEGMPNDMNPQLFSFNYTPLNRIAKEIAPDKRFSYSPIHGTIEKNNCIFGFLDNPQIKGGYRDFQKAMDDNYAPPSLKPALYDARKIIIFGVSMGFIDAVYFKDVFEMISKGGGLRSRTQIPITFVTRDENSKRDIKHNLQDIGISIQSLMTNSNVKFLLTSDDFDIKEFDAI